MDTTKKGRGRVGHAVKQAPTTGWLGGLAPSKANKKTVGFTHRRGGGGIGGGVQEGRARRRYNVRSNLRL